MNHTLFSELPTGDKVFLRSLTADDLEFLHRWENDPSVWQFGDCGFDPVTATADPAASKTHPLRASSGATERFTRAQLKQFIDNQRHDIRVTEQLRLVICLRDPVENRTAHPVGFIDLFDLDPVELTAGVGILICDPAHRRRGYGAEALSLAIEYARLQLGLLELRCTIAADNAASRALFTAAGFTRANIAAATGANFARTGEIFLHKPLI